MSIKNALQLKNHTCQAEGHTFVLRRPSIADMAEAVVQAKQGDPGFSAWLVMNHLVEDGKPVFDTPDEVLACDGSLISFLVSEIDRLYDPDLIRQPSKS